MSPTPPLHSLVGQVTGNLTGDGESGLRIAGFLPHASTIRRSVSDYYSSRAGYFNAFPSTSTSQLSTAAPPTYDDTLQEKSLPPSRFKIEPREEEGNEQLPIYTCSLHREALFDHKMELSSPFDRAGKRNWGKVYAILHGTLLQLHKPKRVPFFSSSKRSHQAGKPMGHTPGEMLKSYTLQLAEIGIAADYRKRHFVIRLRAQTEQFLLSCGTLETFLDWLEALSAAVDLSPALEERSLPRYQTIPRRHRRHRPTRTAQGQQEAIIRRNFPNIGDAAQQQLAAAVIAARDRNGARNPPQAEVAASHRPSLAQESINEQDLRDLQLEITPSPPRTRRQQTQPHRPTQLQEEEENCFSESGKWAPAQNFTAEANMRYARRCMAILCGDAPRQSDYIIKDGKRYKLSWEKKEMVLEEKNSIETAISPLPPTYEEVTGDGIGMKLLGTATITSVGSSSRLM